MPHRASYRIASHRIESHCIASAPSAAAGDPAGDWPDAVDKRGLVRDAGRNWSKGGRAVFGRAKAENKRGFESGLVSNWQRRGPMKTGRGHPRVVQWTEMRPGGASTSSGGQSTSGGCWIGANAGRFSLGCLPGRVLQCLRRGWAERWQRDEMQRNWSLSESSSAVGERQQACFYF
ncbi:hypothetical protein J3F84DRAFT_370317 [Trichoderma pleuroticola]